MKLFNGLMYDCDGSEYITPLFKSVDANTAFQYIIDVYTDYNAVDVIYMGEDYE